MSTAMVSCRSWRPLLVGCVAALLVVTTGCKKEEGTAGAPSGGSATESAKAGLKSGPGVDAEKKVVRVGLLNDESGPAAAIGKPYAVGKRILYARIKAGELKVLPEGWTLEAVEKDHGYNPQQSVQHYTAMKDDVLFIAHSFGTPNTLPLRSMLSQDAMVAFPASLSSQMAEDEHTPPLGPAYLLEAMRAMDFAVEKAGAPEKVMAAVIYQQDDYGKDGQLGWRKAAAKHGVKVLAEVAIAPGQKDFTGVVNALKVKGATHVLLATLPSATGPILGTAAQLQYAPMWVGVTPSWVDAFFNEKVLPPVVLSNFYWSTGLPYWGEDLPGMKDFLAAFEKYKPEGATPDFYTLVSYTQGLIQLEALRRAFEKGDVTREGFLAAMHTIDNWDGSGMLQAISLAKVPYVTATRTRVLKPVLDRKTWEAVGSYAQPVAMDVP